MQASKYLSNSVSLYNTTVIFTVAISILKMHITISFSSMCPVVCYLTHSICVGNLTIIGPDNGLSPGRRQAIIWTNAGILLIGPWGTNLSEILIKIHTFSFKKMRLKVSSAKRRPFCLGLNVLNYAVIVHFHCILYIYNSWCICGDNLFSVSKMKARA